MDFKGLLKLKKTTGYSLSKNTGIPYTTINDLINGKTVIQNISLKNALLIADFLQIDVRDLNNLETIKPVEFRFFRNNLLHELKWNSALVTVDKIIKNREIDLYYKNGKKEYAYYLLALVDYVYRINGIPLYKKRYNSIRQEKLDKPFFVGSDLITFNSVDEAEKELGITVIPEFRKFNIIEEDIFNVA